jgi:hypothetical protein
VNAIRIVISAMVATSCATGAMAQGAQRGSAAIQPNPIPRAAFITTMEAEFRKMDADKNGSLTRKEIEDFQRAVTVAMAQQRNVALFQALDKDGNGQLSTAEFGGLPMSTARPDATPVLAQVDRNRDGQATLIEYRAGKLVNFDQMDSDKDGVVSVAEMRAAGIIK